MRVHQVQVCQLTPTGFLGARKSTRCQVHKEKADGSQNLPMFVLIAYNQFITLLSPSSMSKEIS